MRAGETRRRGLTLLEVLVALSLLGIGAAAWAGLMGQSMHTVREVHARDAEMRAAAAELSHVAVWPAAAFAARVGRRPAGSFILVVQQVTPALYDVAITDTLRGVPLLHTSFYLGRANAAETR